MQKTFRVPNISCGHCVATIERELHQIDGVVSASADEKTKSVTLQWQDPASWETVQRVLKEIHYPVEEE